MITLHGGAASRASRSLLALEELGLPYKQAPLNPWSDAADAETLAPINPNRRIPVLDDDGLILWARLLRQRVSDETDSRRSSRGLLRGRQDFSP